ncbi:MAG: aspartate carbamoyltransferase [Planctomycetota bacterium]
MHPADLLKADPDARLAYLRRPKGIPHFIMARQLERADLERLAAMADACRARAATDAGRRQLRDLLPHKRALLYFNQPSSRTFFSFQNACFILGMPVAETRDPAVTSEKKGESFEDTIRTYGTYTDLLVMRHSADDASVRAVAALDRSAHPVPVVNAGSGKTEHPTQALLDIYTLMREFKGRGGIDGKTILMAGDLKRGRTVRSLCYLLAWFKGVRIAFAAVPEFQMEPDIRVFLKERGVSFQDVDDLAEGVRTADAVYMTRVQDEHDTGGESRKVDLTRFHFRAAYLKNMRPDAVILHPLPRREEIPAEVDDDPRAAYWRQEENGMWARTALIASIFGIREL